MAIVLPDNIFGSKDNELLRRWIYDTCRVVGVVGIPRNSFMPHTAVKTSILFLQKREQQRNSTEEVFFGISELPGKDRRGNLTLTNINRLCRIALDKLKKTYEQDIQEKNIRIVFDNLTLSLMMEVNVEQFSKVLAGILKNSMYALLKKSETVTFSPEIFLGLKVNKDMLEITIRDNGSGIDENIKDKIFAPFFTTKTTGEAAGVGLYLCREIVQNHRGTIEVESKKGEYTQFLITIPVYQPKTITPPKEEE